MDSLYTFDTSTISNSPMINYRKDAKKGVKFTFMVVGELGTGKTTFVNSLLNKKVLSHAYEKSDISDTTTLSYTSAKSVSLPASSNKEFNPRTANEEPGIGLTETKVELVDDDNMKLLLNIINTPGFGSNLNNELCFVEIESYLKQQFDLVLAEETRIKRNPRFVDTRVHVLLYFITPTGHGLREIDISCMKRLSKYVNIIPVVGKADTFTTDEIKHFKAQIKKDIERFNVPTFQFDNYLSEYDDDEDYELIQECKFLANLQPFAIISSEQEFEVSDKDGQRKIIKGRQYPWGLVDINDPKYSDFPILKSVLLGSHLQDLKDLTHDFLYETYRTERLSKVTGSEAEEFHDTFESHDIPGVPSLSNLAQLTDAPDTADTSSITSSSSTKKSMLLEEDEMPSPKFNEQILSGTTLGHDFLLGDNPPPRNPINLNSHNSAFKRLSIGPQRNQLRQISETVPYVIRHERILERQQKLEEMEMALAKELASRAALLEQKAAQLKTRERAMMKRMVLERESLANSPSKSDFTIDESVYDDDLNVEEIGGELRKDETLTDLHSIVN